MPAKLCDVSETGLYLNAERSIATRQLVRVRISDPPDQRGALILNAMVVHSNAREGAPGLGLQLYANGRTERERWESLVKSARDGYETPEVDDPDSVRGVEKPARRGSERMHSILEIRMRSAEELVEMYTRNVSAGGMFIATDVILDIGREIVLDIVHPDTGQTMNMLATVVHQRPEKGRAGVGVQFLDMSDRQRQMFWSFIQQRHPDPA